MKRRNLLLAVAASAALLVLYNCATSTPPLAPQHNQDRDALYKRAVEFWDAIVAKDNLKIAEFLTPKAKEAFQFAQTLGTNTFNTVSYHIDAVEIKDDGIHAIVIVTQTFVASPVPNKRTVPGHVSRWTKLDGIWYREHEEMPRIVSGSRGQQRSKPRSKVSGS